MRQSLSQAEKAFFKALGARIAQRRKELELTQTQLCEAIGIPQQTFASYEIGRRRIPASVIPALAQALMTETDTLLGMPTKPNLKRGRVPVYQQKLEQISRLPKEDQRKIADVIDGMLLKYG